MVSPFLRSKAWHRYILTTSNYGTHYPDAIPLKTTDRKQVAEELVTVFTRMGTPEDILINRGSNFTSRLMMELYHLLGVKSIRSSTYHPQTDGMVERLKRTNKHLLRKVLEKLSSQWDRALHHLMFAYREVSHAVTGLSTFELMYGGKVRGPLDVLKEEWELKSTSPESVVPYMQRVYDQFGSSREVVCERELASKNDQ